MKTIGPAIAVLCVITSLYAAAQGTPGADIKRTPITEQLITPGAHVSKVSVTRLDFSPGQPTPRHLHPVPVMGYVLEGEFIVKLAGRPEQHFSTGQSIYEPADVVIERFDNASASKSTVLIAHYLVTDGQTELIKMLPAN